MDFNNNQQPYGNPNGMNQQMGQQPYGNPGGMNQQMGQQPYGNPNGMNQQMGQSLYSGSAIGNVVKRKKSKLPFIIGGAAVGVAVAGVGVYAAVISGVFMTKQQKILKAAYDTVKEDTFGSNIVNMMEIAGSDQINGNISVKINDSGLGANVDAEFNLDQPESKFSVESNVNVSGLYRVRANAYFDDQKLEVALPDANDSVYMYNYRMHNVGAVTRYLGGEASADKMNEILVLLSDSMKNRKSDNKKFSDSCMKILNEIDVADIPAESFEINGSDVKCDGYKVTLTSDDAIKIADAYDEVYGDEIERLYDILDDMGADPYGYSSVGDYYRQMADYVEDGVYEIYLYGGKIAAINFDGGGQVIFHGGDTRTSEIEITMAGSSLYKHSSRNGNVETGSIEADGMTLGEYTYDLSSGRLSFSNNYGMGMYDVPEITFKADGNRFIFGFAQGSQAADFTLTKGGRVAEPSGTVVDIGSASEMELLQIFTDLSSSFSGGALW